VPGESYLAALDAFYGSDIQLTVCRHESTAAIMAEAAGKITVGLASALSRADPAPPMHRQGFISRARIPRR
jgi:thiamine pyrophosphate-dependent acetolactate synthase large subunit-like protein